MRWTMMAAMAAAVTMAACGSGGGNSTPPANCSSGKAWSNGNEESPLMNPGQDCIACHAQGEGPKFQIAGTVMGASNDDDNCDGLSGVEVQIIGSDGNVLKLTTNAAGNFYSDLHDTPVAMPFTAKVIGPGGKESTMTTPQTTGACNSCHTAQGASGAPGRISVPQ